MTAIRGLAVRRTSSAPLRGYADAGFACIMIEDQVAPKRCGHTEGKSVVGRDEAIMRIRAAVDMRDSGAPILIMARTDARACIGLDEAIARCRAFRDVGADITFLEAPLDEREMRRYCESVDGPKMANLIEGGRTPLLPHATLLDIGYTIAVYPLTMLNVSIRAMRQALGELRAGQPASAAMDFEALKAAVGFPLVLPGGGALPVTLLTFSPATDQPRYTSVHASAQRCGPLRVAPTGLLIAISGRELRRRNRMNDGRPPGGPERCARELAGVVEDAADRAGADDGAANVRQLSTATSAEATSEEDRGAFAERVTVSGRTDAVRNGPPWRTSRLCCVLVLCRCGWWVGDWCVDMLQLEALNVVRGLSGGADET